MGSTAAARRAGIHDATSAAVPSVMLATAMLMPVARRDAEQQARHEFPVASAPAIPRPRPIAVSKDSAPQHHLDE